MKSITQVYLQQRRLLKKTKFMAFHTPQRRVNYPTLKLNNVNIERVSQFNFLGVILASSLKWDKHVAHVSLKVSRVIGAILYRLKRVFPREVLLTLYNALILPHYVIAFLYGVQELMVIIDICSL